MIKPPIRGKKVTKVATSNPKGLFLPPKLLLKFQRGYQKSKQARKSPTNRVTISSGGTEVTRRLTTVPRTPVRRRRQLMRVLGDQRIPTSLVGAQLKKGVVHLAMLS